jgi:glutathione S-transferase
MRRATGVLEGWLTKQGELYPNTDGPWLVGNKLSYADVSFFSWQTLGPMLMGDKFDVDEFPAVKAWMERMKARPAIAAAMARGEELK